MDNQPFRLLIDEYFNGVNIGSMNLRPYLPVPSISGWRPPQGYDDQLVPDQDKPQATNAIFNTPIWTRLTFDAGSYEAAKGREINYGPLHIDTAIIRISQQKEIIRTKVAGRFGTVKEYIADSDYAITIEGVLLSPNVRVYPADQVAALDTILKVTKELGVTCQFLNQFGITHLVIDSYDIPQKPGFRNMQPFQLQCYSEIAMEIIQKQEEEIRRAGA